MSFFHIKLNIRLSCFSKLTLADALFHTFHDLDVIDIDVDIWYRALAFFEFYAVVVSLQAMMACCESGDSNI